MSFINNHCPRCKGTSYRVLKKYVICSGEERHLYKCNDCCFSETKNMVLEGLAPIKLTLHFDGKDKVDILPMQDITVRPCPDFFQQVKASFGPGCLSVQMRQTEVKRKKRFGGGSRG